MSGLMQTEIGLLNRGLCHMLVANSLLQKQEGDELCGSRRRYMTSEGGRSLE